MGSTWCSEFCQWHKEADTAPPAADPFDTLTDTGRLGFNWGAGATGLECDGVEKLEAVQRSIGQHYHSVRGTIWRELRLSD